MRHKNKLIQKDEVFSMTIALPLLPKNEIKEACEIIKTKCTSNEKLNFINEIMETFLPIKRTLPIINTDIRRCNTVNKCTEFHTSILKKCNSAENVIGKNYHYYKNIFIKNIS